MRPQFTQNSLLKHQIQARKYDQRCGAGNPRRNLPAMSGRNNPISQRSDLSIQACTENIYTKV